MINSGRWSLRSPLGYCVMTFPMALFLIVISYQYIDRPLAIWMKNLQSVMGFGSSLGLAVILTQACYVIIVALMLIYFYCRVRRREGYWIGRLGLFLETVAITYFIKMTLQFLFGRYVPRYPGSSGLLFLRNEKLYGFHWFQSGGFPSGHMALLTAALFVGMGLGRAFYIFGVALWLLMSFLLLFLNYHFLSDIVAGSYVGMTTTLALRYLSKQNQGSAQAL